MSLADQRARVAIRRLILDGKLPPNARVTETSLSDQLGISRTPVRMALSGLQVEGLVTKRAGRGYTISEIGINDIRQSVELRGVLEGYAARLLAESGARSGTTDLLHRSIEDISVLIDTDVDNPDFLTHYEQANIRFHETILSECGNPQIARACGSIHLLPPPGQLLFQDPSRRPNIRRLILSNSQHEAILDSIVKRQGARAEAIMREHAYAIVTERNRF